MKDWTEAFKERLLEDRVSLPDGELEVLEGLIRCQKQKRALSWVAVLFAIAASVALVIGFASRKTEQTNSPESEHFPQKYLAETIGEVVVTSEDSYPIVLPPSLVWKPQAPVVSFGVEQKEQEKEIINVEPETQDSTAEKNYGEELNDECPDGTRFDSFCQDSVRDHEKAGERRSSKRFTFAISAGESSKSNVYYDHSFITTTYEKYNHKPQLITYELSLRYQLSDRFDLSSGFCYYGTISDVLMTVQSIDNNDQLFFKQHARYLGMPLHLDWYPLKGYRFSVYAGAGGEAYKCVNAKRGDDRLKDNRVYLSVIALAGLKYEPVRNIGLFVEPQYSHSFLPETPAVRSYITDTPNRFTVKVGLSMGL